MAIAMCGLLHYMYYHFIGTFSALRFLTHVAGLEITECSTIPSVIPRLPSTMFPSGKQKPAFVAVMLCEKSVEKLP